MPKDWYYITIKTERLPEIAGPTFFARAARKLSNAECEDALGKDWRMYQNNHPSARVTKCICSDAAPKKRRDRQEADARPVYLAEDLCKRGEYLVTLLDDAEQEIIVSVTANSAKEATNWALKTLQDALPDGDKIRLKNGGLVRRRSDWPDQKPAIRIVKD